MIFIQQMAVVATLPEFKAWNVKHQDDCPWLAHGRVATLQKVLVLLGNTSSNFDYHEFLKSGDSFPCDKHANS